MNNKSIVYFCVLISVLFACKPVDKRKDLVCEMSKDKLKPILNDIFIYEAGRNTKSLDSLTMTFDKTSMYNFIYKKHDTSRKDIKDAIECLTLKNELLPILEELELSFKNWRDHPDFKKHAIKDTVQ